MHCGNCPAATTQTTATCTGVPTDGGVCTFAVKGEVCVNLTGVWSEVFNVTLVKGISSIV